jgi:integrase
MEINLALSVVPRSFVSHGATFDNALFVAPTLPEQVNCDSLVFRMARKVLNDPGLKALKPAPAGKRYDVMDGVVPGFGVRVTDKGQRTFILVARYSGATNPTRRALGEYGAMTLETAREKARDWIKMIQRGIDPKVVEQQVLREAARARKNSFAAVAEDFIVEKLIGPDRDNPIERKGREVERDIRREFIPVWGQHPITAVTTRDVRDVIKEKCRTAPAQARNLLGTAKRLFAWAVDQDSYGLTASPAVTLKPSKIIGDKAAGQRILSDLELFALWRATERTPYPHGPAYRLLVLTALRLNEGADASRPEFDFPNRLWTIPPERMKGKNGKARPHVVPLTDDVLALLEKLPRFKTGDYLFSTTFGASPVWMSDKVKKRIDQRMLRTLRALARSRGDDPAKVKLTHWTNHDIRRTVRSGLSRLKVSEEAREAVMAHTRPGIKGIYDLYNYLDEKREALELWSARVHAIVTPQPENVVLFAGRAS